MRMRKRTGRSASVAVCFQNGRVNVAHVAHRANDLPVLDICVSMRLEGSQADTLSRLRKKLRLDRFPCTTLMTEGDYQLHVLEAPNVPESELKSAVRWRMKDVLDYPADAATVDVFSVPADPNAPTRGRSVYAVAARNESVVARMSAFADAKLSLNSIDIPEMAQRNIAAMYESPGRALAMLSFTELRGLLTFTANGELYLARNIDVGLAQLRHAEGGQRVQLLDRIVLELQRSLDHFDRQFHYLPLSGVLLAPLPESMGLLSYLADNLYVPVEEIQLERKLNISQIAGLDPRAVNAEQLLAIGAALRDEAP